LRRNGKPADRNSRLQIPHIGATVNQIANRNLGLVLVEVKQGESGIDQEDRRE
jgi:hypothetical protein